MSKKVLSIHQPNFLPWLGFFNKIAKSDVFIVLDSVQYPRGKSVANRNKIKSANGAVEIVVPISKPKGTDGKVDYTEVTFADNKWQKKALRAIENSYSKAPYFNDYFPYLEKLFTIESFCEMNIQFIHDTVERLGIKTKLIKLSDIDGDLGQKNEMIVNLCKQFSCNVYLSGKGAQKYNDEDYMNKNGVELIYQEYDHPTYNQLYGEFVSHLSVIDLIFNLGDAAGEIVK